MDSKKLRIIKEHLLNYSPIYIIAIGFIILSVSFFIELGKLK